MVVFLTDSIVGSYLSQLFRELNKTKDKVGEDTVSIWKSAILADKKTRVIKGITGKVKETDIAAAESQSKVLNKVVKPRFYCGG